MNVTVVVAKPLQAACEGRARIELGVPSTADVADVLQTLLSLYPGLKAFVPSEKRPNRPSFAVASSGRVIYLFSASAQRVSTA
jgi:hypothetical protein